MAEPLVISALEDKAHELRQAIVTYEERLDRTRKELAVVTATITLFQRDGGRITDTRPAAIRNLFKRHEPLRLCKEALAAEPEMTTRALAVACLAGDHRVANITPEPSRPPAERFYRRKYVMRPFFARSNNSISKLLYRIRVYLLIKEVFPIIVPADGSQHSAVA